MVDFDASMEGRGVPRNVDAERAVLGALLLHADADTLDQVHGKLRAEDFYLAKHRLIFRSILDTYDRASQADPITVAEDLERKGMLEEAGGRDILLDLAGTVVSAASIGYHAELVRQKSVQRLVLEACLDTARIVYENRMDSADLIDEAERRIFEIQRLEGDGKGETISAIVMNVLEKLEKLRQNRGALTGVPTRFYDLDEITSGLQSGELIVIAARPSMGKTTLALNLAERVASQGLGVAFFSLEMHRQQIVQNLLCGRASIDSQALRRGRLTEPQYRRLQEEAASLYESPLFVDDTPGLTLMSLRAKCRRLAAKQEIRLVIIDYLQLLSAGGRVESRQQEIATISRGLKSLARELEVPVVALAQLNRDVEARDNHRPRMSDLRESGSIEQDADVVALLHREDYYNPTEENADLAQLIIAKQRNGPTGEITLRFFRETMRFENFSRPAEPLR
jgi:replicative DNA helicase